MKTNEELIAEVQKELAEIKASAAKRKAAPEMYGALQKAEAVLEAFVDYDDAAASTHYMIQQLLKEIDNG